MDTFLNVVLGVVVVFSTLLFIAMGVLLFCVTKAASRADKAITGFIGQAKKNDS